jgi:hypothetical protein
MRSDCRRAKFSRRYSAFCRSRMIYLDGRPGAPRRSRLERLSTSVSDPSKAVAYERSRGRAGSRLIISATTISAPRTRRLTGCAAHQRRHECGSHELYPQLSSAALGVWEWTSDWYSTKHQTEAPKACCVPVNPRGLPRPRATTPANQTSGFHARFSKAAHISARPTTAAAIAPLRAIRSRLIPRRATSGFAACRERKNADLRSNRPPCRPLPGLRETRDADAIEIVDEATTKPSAPSSIGGVNGANAPCARQRFIEDLEPFRMGLLRVVVAVHKLPWTVTIDMTKAERECPRTTDSESCVVPT